MNTENKKIILMIMIIFSLIQISKQDSINRTIVNMDGQAFTYSTYLNSNGTPIFRAQFDIACKNNASWTIPNFKTIRICLEIGTPDNYLQKRQKFRFEKMVTDLNFTTRNILMSNPQTENLTNYKDWCTTANTGPGFLQQTIFDRNIT